MTLLNDDALLRGLEDYKEKFLFMRERLGLDDRIGFGMIPKAHEAFSLAMLVNVRLIEEGKISYLIDTSDVPRFGILKKSEQRRLILPPNFKKHPTYVLSIYYRDMIRNKQRLPRSIPLELEGFIAHELSHMVKELKKVPKTIQNILRKRRADFKSVQREIILTAKRDKKDEDLALIDDYRVKASKEAEIDMIASLLGFKDCILAKLDFMQA